ncbi:MAG: acyltransferase family protein [Chloroflexi bacterium]|nr:acyltransferase family protein [Chloroflexota bacterium]
MSQSKAYTLPYRPAIDGLRAIAVLGVIFYHLQEPWALGGYLGVETFFVVSGYLITSLLLRDIAQFGHLRLRRFWWRRIRRLGPALWVFLLATVALSRLIAPATWPRLRADLPAALAYYLNWHYIWRHVPYFERYLHPPLIQHLWSLAVEEQFYLVWPLFLALLLYSRRRAAPAARLAWLRRLWPLMFALAFASLARMGWLAQHEQWTWAYYGTDARAAGFLIGGAFAFLWPLGAAHEVSQGLRRWLAWLAPLGLAGIFSAYATLHEFTPWLYPWAFLGVALSTAAVLLPAALAPDSLWSRALGHPLLRWVGTRSYAMYLWHWPLIALFRPGAECLWPHSLCVLGHLLFVALLSEWSYRTIEHPIRRWGFRAWARTLPRRAGTLGAGALLFALTAGFLTWRPWVNVEEATAVIESAAPLALTATEAPHPTTATLAPPPRATNTEPRRPPAMQTATPPRPSALALASTDKVPSLPASLSAPLTAVLSPTATEARLIGTPSPAWTCYVTLIGDSVMARTYSTWMAYNGLQYQFYMDAQANRTPGQVLPTIDRLAREGYLYPNVVLHIGTNVMPSPGILDQIFSRLIRAGVRKIYLVNIRRPVGWLHVANQRLAQAAERWPQVILVDWAAASEGHPAWFLADGTHLSQRGAQAYVALVRQAIDKYGCAP